MSDKPTGKFTVDLKGNDKAREVFLQGMRNLHAVEVQAAETIEKQLSRYETYPELHERMQIDLSNSKAQAARLERLLGQHKSSASATKELVASIVGSVAGLVHIAADDQVIKDVLAAAGYKQFEIASYIALIAMAHAIGDTDCPPILEECLVEEHDMSAWLENHTPSIVTSYLQRHVNEA